MEHAQHLEHPGIGPALFGDGAAAFVLCNSLAPELKTKSIYELRDWMTAIVPGTAEEMSYRTMSTGFLLHLSKNVPKRTSEGLKLAYDVLLGRSEKLDMRVDDFDWAVHPGGQAVLNCAKDKMGMSDEALRASWEIYRERGNISSVTVIAVLDKLRNMGHGKDDVVAASFGPGLTVEAAMLKRSRSKSS